LVLAALLAGAVPATAAPGGGHGGGGGGSAPPFTISPTNLTFAALVNQADTELLTLTAGRKSVAFVGNTAGAYSFTNLGTCWTTYLNQGLAVPANTSCTIEIAFIPSSGGLFPGSATITNCPQWNVVNGKVNCKKQDPSTAVTVSLSGTATAAPDLDIAGIILGDGVTAQGYVVVVRNLSNAAADLTGVGVQGYYEPTTTYDSTTGTGACGQTFNNGTILGAGATINITVGCSGAGASGDKFLVVRVDNTNALAESDEANNDFAKGLVDFEIGGITIEGANGTDLFHHTVTVRNIGGGAYDGSALSRVASYFSADAFLDGTDRGLDCATTLPDAIAAGAEVGVPRPCNSTPQAGENYLIAVVDAAGTQYEAREANNAFAVALPKADLTVSAQDLQWGFGTLSYQANVTVTGTLPIETSTILVVGVWTTDDVFGNGDDNPACGSPLPPDQASNGDVVSVVISCPNPGPSAGQKLIVKVDAGSPEAVAESNENNNYFVAFLT
jgi:hypothetical protein